MKSIILMMALAGFTLSANAQNSANSKFAKNYPVCLKGNTYQVCKAGEAMSPDVGRSSEASTFGMQNTYVHMGYGTTGNARFRSRIRVSYDNPGDVYKGKETMTNDGVRKNKARNLNTNNGGYDLPPNDGGSL